MRLAFRKKAFCHIAEVNNEPGKYGHTELVFSDGRWFSSRIPGGVAYNLGRYEKHYDFVDFTLSVEDEAKVRAKADTMEGEDYNWKGLWGKGPRPNHEYCTEAVVKALQAVGLFPEVKASYTHSTEFHRLAVEAFGDVETQKQATADYETGDWDPIEKLE